MSRNKIEIYHNSNGESQLEVVLENETVWLSREQITALFGRDRTVIGRHISNIFKEGELVQDAVRANFAHTAKDGKTYQVDHYNLDVIISVGYRVKSQQGVHFRQWATRLLKQHLIQGYTLNQQRFDKNSAELQQALALIKKAAQSPALNSDEGRGLVEIISRYTQTFLWLQRYDEGLLDDPQGQSGGVLLNPDDAMQSLNDLKAQLMARGEATELFAKPRGDGLASLLGILSNLFLVNSRIQR